MEQGRLAAAHAFGVEAPALPAVLPYGLYTVPEISMVGRTEAQLTEEGVPYETGTAQYREIARGQIVGDLNGMLKLIFHLETRELLGVHVIGEGAAELVHIGQAVMAFGGRADYFVDTVFNYPTLAECYKTAAFDAINRMSELGIPARRDERAARPRSRGRGAHSEPCPTHLHPEPVAGRGVSSLCSARPGTAPEQSLGRSGTCQAE